MAKQTFVFTCTYKNDVDRFKDLLKENNAYLCAELKVPFWTKWGDPLFEQYAIVYQAESPIGDNMEILT